MRDTRTKLAVQLEATYDSPNRDIYSSALPHYLDRSDLTTLDKDGDLFAYNFIETLLQDQPFELALKPSFEAAEKLRHIYFESRNQERIKGQRSVGFGYPLFVEGKGDQLRIFPVFIWNVQLEPSSNNTITWSLSYQKDQAVLFNPILLESLEIKHGPEVRRILERHHQSDGLTSSDLLNTINELAALLCLEESFKNISICPFPTLEEIDELPFEGAFYWSGLVGLFPTAQQLLNPAAVPLFHAPIQQQEGHEFGILNVDPSQASALKSVFQSKLTLVDGDAGSGKTHFLIQLLSNILLNKQNCLVISESIPSLQEIQNTLSSLGISQFNFLFRNIHKDKALFQELLRTAKGDAPKSNYSKDELRILLDKTKRQKAKLDEHYRSLRRKVFGNFDWTETVGRYMRSNRLEGKELLASQLNSQDFQFTYEEYIALEQAIDEAYPLYQKVNTLRHPLKNLNKTIFTDLNKSDSLAFIQRQTSFFSERVVALQQKFISKIDIYKANLIEHYDNSYLERAGLVEQMQEKIKDYSNQYGDSFMESGKGTLRLYSIVSNKHKESLNAKEEVTEMLRRLQKLQEERSYFDYSFTVDAREKDMAKINSELQQYGEELETWRTLHPAIVQEEITRLSSKNAHEKLYFEEQITSLEKELDELVAEINAVGLYEEPMANKTLTLSRRQKYLEEILEQLENTNLYLRDFDQFYDWQHHWLSLPDHARKLIRALIKVKPANWVTALESWYLDNVLTANYDPSLLINMNLVEEYFHNELQLRPLLKAQLPSVWEQEQDRATKELRRKDRSAYNLLFSKHKEGKPYPEIKEIFDADLATVSSMLPILMMTPDIALNLIPEIKAHFDFVILEEAQSIALTKAAHLMALGKKQVLVGNSKQYNPNNLSIHEEASIRGLRTYALNQFHNFNPGNLWQVRDAVYFEDQMKAFNIRFAQADGRFEEVEGINDAEAQYIIRILNQIKKTPQRTFPTVGIVCMTVQQRNLIADYLLKIKQKRSPGFEKIQQLERNGLGVYCVDELTGQHFDILIVSGTFGTIDVKGTLTNHLNWLNSADGLPVLNLLMGRANQELFIVNSIPPEELEARSIVPENKGTFILANYFLYARAWELSNKKEKREILSRMEAWHKMDEVKTPELVFRKEVAYAMQPYLEQGRIVEAPQKSLPSSPFLIKGITEDKAAILLWPDGFAAETFSTDFSWEYRYVQDLKNRGLEHLPVWSANWWRNPSKEARRLASAIIKLDSE